MISKILLPKKETVNPTKVNLWVLGRRQGQAVLLFDIWLHSEVILFYPTLPSWCNSLNKKAQKKNYKKEDSNR